MDDPYGIAGALRFGIGAGSARASAQSRRLVKRGGYLVNTIMTCGNCHTPKGPPATSLDKAFSGGLSFDEPPFKVTAPNITPDKETGIGKWTRRRDQDGCCATACGRTACRVADGHAERLLRDPDRARSRRASSPICGRSSRSRTRCRTRSTRCRRSHIAFPGAEKPYTEADMSDKVKKRLLSRHHRPLHGVPHADGAGAAANSRIRSARAASNSPGLGACRCRATSPRARPRASAPGPTPRSSARSPQGVQQGRQQLKPPMGYHYYAKMTDGDLDAVVAYLRTVPPKE